MWYIHCSCFCASQYQGGFPCVQAAFRRQASPPTAPARSLYAPFARSKAAALSGVALYHILLAVLLECFFSISFIQSLVIYYKPDNSTPIKIYEFVLKPILDYVSVYEASHEPYILQLTLAIAPHNNNKTGHISPFLC